MKKREFNKILREVSDKKTGLLDQKKIALLPDATKESVVFFIVRNRAPIVKEFIPDGFDWSWLHCMGYLYETKGKVFTFIHTSEQKVK